MEAVKAAACNQSVLGVRILKEDIDTMTLGEWMNDAMANLLAEGVYKWLDARKRMFLMDSLSLDYIKRNELGKLESTKRCMMVEKLPSVVGLLNIGNYHWVCYRVDYRESVEVDHYTRRPGAAVGRVEMRILDSCLPVLSVSGPGLLPNQQHDLVWCAGGKMQQSSMFPFPDNDNVVINTTIRPVLEYYSKVFEVCMPPVHKYRATLRVFGTGQQADEWACGRWAVANLATLIMHGPGIHKPLQLPVSFELVQARLLRMAELLLCGEKVVSLNPFKWKRATVIE